MPTIVCICVYYFTYLDNDITKFLIFLLTLVATASYGTSMGFLLGCMFDNLATAMQLVSLCTIVPIIYNGMIVNLVTTPWYLKWISYISAYRYCTEALVYNQFADSHPEIMT